eukprot:scaffold61046_cov25-Prasinocladus_malaysianus.AAC.1
MGCDVTWYGLAGCDVMPPATFFERKFSPCIPSPLWAYLEAKDFGFAALVRCVSSTPRQQK